MRPSRSFRAKFYCTSLDYLESTNVSRVQLSLFLSDRPADMTFEPAADRKINSEVLSKDDMTSSQLDASASQDLKPNKVPWYAYIWDYEPDRTHEERVFVSSLMSI